jgi:ABC-type polysaccharide/polyol phosphate transport system ATPase subunit
MVWALREVSFKVMPGELVGVLGQDGSGRSTLLKILGGIATQTSGWVEMPGRVTGLLDGLAGLDLELTGRENIYHAGDLLGFDRADVHERIPYITGFAELEPMLDLAVKHYATAMQARLAFTTASLLYPNVFLVDDLLSLTDPAFQKRCWSHLLTLTKSGTTVMLVTHQLQRMASLCKRVLFLDKGRLASYGSPPSVIQHFQGVQVPAPADDHAVLNQQAAGNLAERLIAQMTGPLAEQLTKLLAAPLAREVSGCLSYPVPTLAPVVPEPTAEPDVVADFVDFSTETEMPPETVSTPVRYGDGRVRCNRAVLLDTRNDIMQEHVSGEDMRVYLDLEADCDLEDMEIGLTVSSMAGFPLISCWTREAGLSVNFFQGPQSFLCHFRRVSLRPGHTFKLDVWIGRVHDNIALDYCPAALTIPVVARPGFERFSDLPTLGGVLADSQWFRLTEPMATSSWLVTP